jgi:rhodanese-related sulfurtransferase
MKSLKPSEVVDLIQSDNNVRLIDVREKWEYDIVHLPQSELMPLSCFQAHLDKLNTEDKILVYCHHGVRSISVCNFLITNGFKNILNLSGGIDAWVDEVDQNIKRY